MVIGPPLKRFPSKMHQLTQRQRAHTLLFLHRMAAMVGWLQQDLMLLGAHNLLSKLQTKHTHNTNTCKYLLCQPFAAVLTQRSWPAKYCDNSRYLVREKVNEVLFFWTGHWVYSLCNYTRNHL